MIYWSFRKLSVAVPVQDMFSLHLSLRLNLLQVEKLTNRGQIISCSSNPTHNISQTQHNSNNSQQHSSRPHHNKLLHSNNRLHHSNRRHNSSSSSHHHRTRHWSMSPCVHNGLDLPAVVSHQPGDVGDRQHLQLYHARRRRMGLHHSDQIMLHLQEDPHHREVLQEPSRAGRTQDLIEGKSIII